MVDWEEDHAKNWDANNLISKLRTWQTSDISIGPIYQGNFEMALKSIKAKTILDALFSRSYIFHLKIMPLKPALYANVEFRPFDSPFGHCAANPGNDSDFTQPLRKAYRNFWNTKCMG